MSDTKFLLFLSLGLVLMLWAAPLAQACSCGPKPTVLDSYERATQVVVVKAINVEKRDPNRKPQPDEYGYDSGEYSNIRSTTMQVEKVFKGTLKAGEEIKFGQGGGADCIWTFSEKSIGETYLFYLYAKEQKPAYWLGFGCGRSRHLEYAADDLLYLENMAKVRGKTRISGTLSFSMESPLEGDALESQNLVGRKVVIKGKRKTYELTTDKNGVFEIYGLPPGKYSLMPEIPKGMKVDEYGTGSSEGGSEDEEDNYRKNVFQITLSAGRHAYFDFDFEVSNTLRGKVLDPNNNPLEGVCLHAVPAEGKMRKGFYKADCTNDDGSFEIEEVPPGSYVLIANEDGKISSSEPFGLFYYPNVTERARAAVITLGFGESQEGLILHAPSVAETITVEGVFLFSDGKPVIDERVEFKADPTEAGMEGDTGGSTDTQGRFSLKILKGLKGTLSGGMYTYSGEFENCPKLEALIKKSGENVPEIKTPAIQIEAAGNLYNIELKFPFPSCQKARTSDAR